jgi:predicted O-linked N-acetylglucosamine transferase (SPINDLY family)
MEKAGRNDPCPCGSGKKYKQCCMQGTVTPPVQASLPPSPMPPAAATAPTAAEIAQLVDSFNARRFGDMEAFARAMLARTPQSPLGWKALGTALLEQGKDALHALQQAAHLIPNDHETWNNLGNALQNVGRPADALICYQNAVRLVPHYAEAHCGQSPALLNFGRIDEAADCCKRALILNPAYAMAHNNLGNALRDRRQTEEALICYRRALAIDSEFSMARGNLLMALQYLPAIDRTEVLTEHQRFGAQFETRLKPHWPKHTNTRDPNKRLKIGYVSGDFRNHAVSYFMEPIFAHHDKAHFEIFAYSNNLKHDAYTERMQDHADHWLNCAGMTDAQLAQRILADGIDILVDLAGHTAKNRLPVFAYKPAPIQITFLGYPGTSGFSAMDYRLTDHFAEPLDSGADRYYSEKLLRLPESIWCYRPADTMPEVTPLPALTNGYLTFGSFNNGNKLNADCVELWAAILRRLPSARLLMATIAEGEMRNQLTEQFAARGIAPERISYHAQLPTHEFHLLLQQVDVSLDPFPVNGATTTCESLWFGIPVLALIGKRFVSRAGWSVLNAARMPEFAAESPEQLIEIANNLAANLPKLAALRANMREHLRQTPLFDQALFTRNLEHAYWDVWQSYTSV